MFDFSWELHTIFWVHHYTHKVSNNNSSILGHGNEQSSRGPGFGRSSHQILNAVLPRTFLRGFHEAAFHLGTNKCINSRATPSHGTGKSKSHFWQLQWKGKEACIPQKLVCSSVNQCLGISRMSYEWAHTWSHFTWSYMAQRGKVLLTTRNLGKFPKGSEVWEQTANMSTIPIMIK